MQQRQSRQAERQKNKRPCSFKKRTSIDQPIKPLTYLTPPKQDDTGLLTSKRMKLKQELKNLNEVLEGNGTTSTICAWGYLEPPNLNLKHNNKQLTWIYYQRSRYNNKQKKMVLISFLTMNHWKTKNTINLSTKFTCEFKEGCKVGISHEKVKWEKKKGGRARSIFTQCAICDDHAACWLL